MPNIKQKIKKTAKKVHDTVASIPGTSPWLLKKGMDYLKSRKKKKSNVKKNKEYVPQTVNPPKEITPQTKMKKGGRVRNMFTEQYD
tara:strand:- start:1615 stop:1872 length:258 start_codon:yes stop_codon:yes gene_type:complete